jgi:hypothetical protein
MVPRRRQHGNDANPRYFLIKPGIVSGAAGIRRGNGKRRTAFIEAFRSGQPLFRVTA